MRVLSVFALVPIIAIACTTEATKTTPAKPIATSTITTSTITQPIAKTKEHEHGGGGHRGDGSGRGGGGDDDEGPDPTLGAGIRRNQGTTVYLDGVLMGVILYGELPPGLAIHWHTLDDGKTKIRRYSVGEYLEAIGIDLAPIKDVHLYGGRVVRLTGKDFRKYKKELQFSLTAETTGRPKMHFPGGLPKNTSIDKLAMIALYKDKPAPTWNLSTRKLELDGKPVEGVPYLDSEIRGGVRVWLDGKLATTIKRNMLPTEGALVRDENGTLKWKLGPFLEWVGVAIAGVKTADLILIDERVARMPAAELFAGEFSVVPKAGGAIAVHPVGKQASALLLYAKKSPPEEGR